MPESDQLCYHRVRRVGIPSPNSVIRKEECVWEVRPCRAGSDSNLGRNYWTAQTYPVQLADIRTGHLPLARLDESIPLFTQHHEALHHHFNCLTTLGNSLNLLAQLAAKCPGPIGKAARRVASSMVRCSSQISRGPNQFRCVQARAPQVTARRNGRASENRRRGV